jgi:RNA-directed DNA polymerase
MNEFDQFVKHELKAQYYIRYADDFVLLSEDKKWLETMLPLVADFLEQRLKLSLHPDKVFIKTLASGVDFLGWVHFPDRSIVRTVTKRRMFKRIVAMEGKDATVQSYLGLLQHGNAKKTVIKVRELAREYSET